jgi:glycosyltransferase involved in cell wall biosynthesis
MRILALTSWWPEPANNGSRLRIASLLRAMAQRHDIHLISFFQEPVTEAQIRRMREICTAVEAIPQPVWRPRPGEQILSLWHPEPSSFRATWSAAFDACVRRAATDAPDMVIAFQTGVARYALSVPGVPRLLEELEVGNFYTHVHLQKMPHHRLRAWLTWRKQTAYIRRLLGHFDACTVVSVNEQRLTHAIAPGATVYVLPNGTDVSVGDQDWGAPQPDTLIYPGALTFDANFDAVDYFLRDIFPRVKAQRPEVRFVVTGNAPPTLRTALPQIEGVEFTGYVPDVRPVIARSWCEVVPLRSGGGTRLKVLEALALGVPVVSTPKGIEGLALDDDIHVLVAPTTDEFVDATLRILDQPELRARLAEAGRRRVAELYDWRIIGQQMNELIEEIIRQHSGRRSVYSTHVRKGVANR